MNIPVIFQFLKEVSANNNREWFNAHKDLYEEARGEFENLLSAIITRISLFDESIRGVQVKDCTYRIYRDTRFSQDKTPYKTHLGGYINARGKKSDHCGYYVHIEPGNCLSHGFQRLRRQAIATTCQQTVARFNVNIVTAVV